MRWTKCIFLVYTVLERTCCLPYFQVSDFKNLCYLLCRLEWPSVSSAWDWKGFWDVALSVLRLATLHLLRGWETNPRLFPTAFIGSLINSRDFLSPSGSHFLRSLLCSEVAFLVTWLLGKFCRCCLHVPHSGPVIPDGKRIILQYDTTVTQLIHLVYLSKKEDRFLLNLCQWLLCHGKQGDLVKVLVSESGQGQRDSDTI